MNDNTKKSPSVSAPPPVAGAQADTAKSTNSRDELDARLRRLNASQVNFSRAVTSGTASMARKY